MTTGIQWTDETWNPIVGCSKISAGCLNCYAADAAKSARLQQFDRYQKVKKWDGTIEFVEPQLSKLSKWKQPKKIFVCSMSDLFHDNISDEWRDKVFEAIALSPQHTFQILTKRPDNMQRYLSQRKVLENVWVGTTVENQVVTSRIDTLIKTPAFIRWISVEPILSNLTLNLDDIDWVVVGGESGKNARDCELNWIQNVVDQCVAAKVPVFVKQLGQQAYLEAKRYKTSSLKNGNENEFPPSLQLRQFPIMQLTNK